MPNTQERPSISTTLEQKYNDQHVGGAFDAKAIVVDGTRSPLQNSVLSTLRTPAGFKTKAIEGLTELKEINGESSLETSLYVKGFNNTRYGDSIAARGR